ncbi:type II toxin-antitoxin system Phd/YefM family antitoxin [Kineococcus aurantiacus]|uniref:Antitoxin n=1 Tax=Kineococcus aurantiacus TaxID=37633 RepID=A0A7Y9J0I5_9ACTN|nr:type II toxin-antitoxin system Phd/YefM family antitoxin [Kineococcus aurantiacus]NYD22326.1 hypothetical protein [Kineococcus aurantiacus]
MELDPHSVQTQTRPSGPSAWEARERAEEFRRDAREDPATAIYPHADLSTVDLATVVDGIVRRPLVITRDDREAAVLVSVDFFNRAHAAVELLEDDATAEAEDAFSGG